MAQPRPGRTTIRYLLDQHRLEEIAGLDASGSASAILARATKRLATAASGLDHEDYEGTFVASYDGYRMSAEALLARQSLRATGGDGSHVTVEDAQWALEIARSVLEGVEHVLRDDPPGPFTD